MTAVGNIVWGPASFGDEFDSSITFSSWAYALDDSNDAIAGIFNLPKDGTITKIGFYVNAVTGSPPTYKVGLTTIGTDGVPAQSAYGGSSIDDYTPSTTGWKWVTLGTPATANAGEFACVHIFPGASAPNGSNCIAINNTELFYYVTPWYRQYSTSWNYGGGAIPMAIQYDDGTIVGFPVINTAAENVSSATTPDEVGCIFTLPIDMTVTGFKFWSSGLLGTGTFEFNLYDSGNNALGTVTLNTATIIGAGYYLAELFFGTPVDLVAGETYRLTMKGTSANAGYLDGWQFNSATDRQTITYPESGRWYKTERTDSGAWTDSDDSVMHMGLIVTDIVGGTSGSGAGPGGEAYLGFIG